MPNEPEKPDKAGAVDGKTAETADRVMAAVEGVPAAEEVFVAGVRISARESHEKFKQALALVEQHLGDIVDIDLSKIEFRKLEGNLVGEAVERATLLDPEIFRHPVFVITQVVAHELLHKNTRIPNEGLVQAAVERVFGKSADVAHSYAEMVRDFEKLAGFFDENDDSDAGIKEIYRLYDAEDYEAIFEGYHKNHILRLETDDEKDGAFEFFHKVFPELEYEGKKLGYEVIKALEDPTSDPE